MAYPVRRAIQIERVPTIGHLGHHDVAVSYNDSICVFYVKFKGVPA